MLEATRRHAPDAPFAHMSTNKVYGDIAKHDRAEGARQRAGTTPTREYRRRHPRRTSRSTRASTTSSAPGNRVAADVMVQEYGRYFGLKCCALRGGCLTGPNHTGVELHGFLSYLVKCNLEERDVQDPRLQGEAGPRQHPLVRRRRSFIEAFWQKPRPGEVYNLGGGRENSCSILEAFLDQPRGRSQKRADALGVRRPEPQG